MTEEQFKQAMAARDKEWEEAMEKEREFANEWQKVAMEYARRIVELETKVEVLTNDAMEAMDRACE